MTSEFLRKIMQLLNMSTLDERSIWYLFFTIVSLGYRCPASIMILAISVIREINFFPNSPPKIGIREKYLALVLSRS